MDVYFRDVRYVAESANTLLFWLVPVLDPSSTIPPAYPSLYPYNPIAAVVLVYRNILLDTKAPPPILLGKLVSVSLVSLVAAVSECSRR